MAHLLQEQLCYSRKGSSLLSKTVISVNSMLIPAPTNIEVQIQLNLTISDLVIQLPMEEETFISQNTEKIMKFVNVSKIPVHLNKIERHIWQQQLMEHIPSTPTTITITSLLVSLLFIVTSIAVYSLCCLRRMQQPVSQLHHTLIHLNDRM